MPSLSSSQVATVSLTCACAASIRRGSGGADRVFPRARVGWEIKLPQSALTLSPRRRGLSAVCVLALKNLTLWKEVEKSLKVEKSLSRAIRRTGQAQPAGDRTGRQRNISEALRVQLVKASPMPTVPLFPISCDLSCSSSLACGITTPVLQNGGRECARDRRSKRGSPIAWRKRTGLHSKSRA